MEEREWQVLTLDLTVLGVHFKVRAKFSATADAGGCQNRISRLALAALQKLTEPVRAAELLHEISRLTAGLRSRPRAMIDPT